MLRRSREYLTPHEVEKLIAAAKLGRDGHRDATLSSWPFVGMCGAD
jgi:hypothetical protein